MKLKIPISAGIKEYKQPLKYVSKLSMIWPNMLNRKHHKTEWNQAQIIHKEKNHWYERIDKKST